MDLLLMRPTEVIWPTEGRRLSVRLRRERASPAGSTARASFTEPEGTVRFTPLLEVCPFW